MWQTFTDWLYGVFVALFQKIESLAYTFFDMLKDVFFWLFDTIMGFAVQLLDVVSFPATFQPTQYISALPPEVSNMMGLIGLNEATTIIVTAIIIRIGLQLIPLVRLGS